LTEYLKIIQVYESIITDIIKIRYVKNYSKILVDEKIDELKKLDISIMYRDSLILFLSDS